MTSLRDSLLSVMGNAKYRPLDKSELARTLEIPSGERAQLRALLSELEKSGQIIKLKKGKFALRHDPQSLSIGHLKILRSGKCLFVPEADDPVAQQLLKASNGRFEISLEPHRRNTALNGDKIAVRLTRSLPRQWKKYHKGRPPLEECQVSARVEKVLERKQKMWVGVYRQSKAGHRLVHGDGTSSPEYIQLVSEPRSKDILPESGQLVTVLPVTWSGLHTPSQGRLLEVLGWPDDQHVDILTVIRKYGLPSEFPKIVEAEVQAIPEEIPTDELERREDWTDRCVVTIDPQGARDFDDAIHVHATESGWVLAVHIADVSHYVAPKSALDNEARERGNSTYLPDRVLPMLPHRLCNDLCSLREGEIRLTKVCEMAYDQQGKRTSARFADAYICNRSQLTYPEALNIMQGVAGNDRDRMIHEAWKLACLLRERRFQQGALDLQVPEVRVLLNPGGRPVSIVSDDYDESHQLIEEFMIAANEAVAEALKNHQVPTIYRVHESPDDGKLAEFSEMCQQYGFEVPEDLHVKGALSHVLDQIHGHSDESILRLALLKSLMRARYDISPLGHFGLALTNYCHFTSPIRRYADLVVHRSLSKLLSNAQPQAPGAGSLEFLRLTSDHISDTERQSAEAEKEATLLKLFEWLEDQSYSSTPEVHQAVITDVRHFGLLVEIPRLQLKGMIKEDDFPDGRWYYEGFANRWSSFQGGSLYPGLTLSVIPAHVDRARQWVDFRAVSVPEEVNGERFHEAHRQKKRR